MVIDDPDTSEDETDTDNFNQTNGFPSNQGGQPNRCTGVRFLAPRPVTDRISRRTKASTAENDVSAIVCAIIDPPQRAAARMTDP